MTRKPGPGPRPPSDAPASDWGVSEKLVVGLYVRVSTESQTEGESLEEQENELRKFCDYKGYKIHKLYIEKGRSGGNTNRPEYQALLKDISTKKLNAVVVKKLDRLSRSLMDFESLMVILQTHQVEFISLREQFDTTTAMGKAMLRIALVFAQLEREQTSERISDVMGYRASKGLHNGGVTPFGYACVNKEWVPFKKEKEVVEFIFRAFLNTRSTVITAAQLNRDGIKTRKNQLWDCRRILDILKNPAYLGARRWNGQVYPDTQPPIISVKMFEEVQAQLKTGTQPKAINSPFQRLLVCGDCRSSMTPSYSLNRTKCRYYYYRCARNYGKLAKPCSIKTISFVEIDKRVAQALGQLADQLPSIEEKIRQHNAKIEAETIILKADISQLNHQMATLKDRQNTFLDSLILPNLTTLDRKRIQEKLTELELETKQTQGVLSKKEFECRQKDDEKFNLSDIKQAISECQSLDITDPISYRDTLRKLIQDITVYPSRLTIQFRWIPWPFEYENA